MRFVAAGCSNSPGCQWNKAKSKAKTKSKARVSATEARLLFETLHARITEFEAASADKLTVEDFRKTGSSFADYAKVLRSVYRTGRAQQEIIRLCQFATQFVDSEKRLLAGTGGAELKTLVSPHQFIQKRKAAKSLFDRLVKTESELRWLRLRQAGDVLSSAGADLPQRFAAAFAARLDGVYLRQTLVDDSGYSFERFEKPGQADKLQQLVDQAQHDAGELWDKSYGFHAGLDWWRRGRFGRGPYGGGMLKGFDALRSLDQQVALSMPDEFPEVSVSNSQSSIRMGEYPLSRRHKYHWQIEPPKGVSYKVRKWLG